MKRNFGSKFAFTWLSFFPPHPTCQRKHAFTLAEVLITLGIIGVVAALTIPTLIATHRKHEVETKLAKIYSVFNQAISRSSVEHGDVTSWAIDCGTSSNVTCTSDEAMSWFNEYIGHYLQIVETQKKDDGNEFYVFFNDGTIMAISNYIHDMTFYINKKSIDNPKAGVNSFAFRFNPVLRNGQTPDKNKYTINPTLEPYAWNWDGTREGLITSSNGYGCGETRSLYCAKLIQYEGWKIPNDYAFKF